MLVSPEPRGHFVQFAGADDRPLIRNAGRFFFEGLQRGDGTVMIATPARSVGIIAEIMRLGGDPEAAVTSGQLVVFDCDQTLDSICIAGQPDAQRFDALIGSTLRKFDGRKVRAYGEMVSKLWATGRRAQAISLENLWSELQRDTAFALFCSYTIDVFGPEFEIAGIDPVLCAHTELLPSGLNRALDRALDSAMQDVLGDRVETLRDLIKANYRPAWAILPRAEGVILWLRNNLPDLADEIVRRARAHYEALTENPSWEAA